MGDSNFHLSLSEHWNNNQGDSSKCLILSLLTTLVYNPQSPALLSSSPSRPPSSQSFFCFFVFSHVVRRLISGRVLVEHVRGGDRLAEQGRQCVANGLGHARRPAERAGPGDPLREHREEEVGRQQRLHGAVRVRCRGDLLGRLGLQDVLRPPPPPLLGQGGGGARPGLPHQAGDPAGVHPFLQGRGDGRDADRRALLPHGDHGLLPVRLCGHHPHPPRRLPPRPDELPRLDALRPPLAHLLLHRRRLLPLGRRLPLPLGRHGLLRRLRHPPLLRHRRFHRCLLGRAEVDDGQGEVPAEQRATDADGSGAAVDGVGGVQRRRPLLRQHRLVAGGAQHQHLRRHQPACVDLPRRHLLQEAVRHRSRAGHDHRPRLHHSRRRFGPRLGCDSDGHMLRQHPLVHHDGRAQALSPPPED
ncbi:hypothetical protein Cni_G12269 [Canna indica]|uniref:Uncharacterized protein n=1 Tax=Canna indica TaxID=4628 RepID=A0AAQ3K825_9LILI|nr:hypothetical protein Cni_G12269 [Canna indica]